MGNLCGCCTSPPASADQPVARGALEESLERARSEEKALQEAAAKQRDEAALMRKHRVQTIEEARRKEAEEKARQVRQWAAAAKEKARSIQQWTDAAVLVVLREAIPKLKDLKGWGSLTEGSDLRPHALDGIWVDEEGRVTTILLYEKGLEGE